MLCPRCFEDKHVTEYTQPSNEYIYRQRKCKACGFRWTTCEGDLDRMPEEFRAGDGYDENSRRLNSMLQLKKPKDGFV